MKFEVSLRVLKNIGMDPRVGEPVMDRQDVTVEVEAETGLEAMNKAKANKKYKDSIVSAHGAVPLPLTGKRKTKHAVEPEISA